MRRPSCAPASADTATASTATAAATTATAAAVASIATIPTTPTLNTSPFASVAPVPEQVCRQSDAYRICSHKDMWPMDARDVAGGVDA